MKSVLEEYETINKMGLSPADLSRQYSRMAATQEFLDLPVKARLICASAYFALILNALQRHSANHV